MNLLKFLFQKCRAIVVVSLCAALISGACNAGLLALINHLINQPGSPALLIILAFAALVLGKLLTGFVSQVWLVRFSQQAIADLRRNLVRKVIDVPLRQFENIGAGKIMAALTDDVGRLTAALFAFPIVAVNLAILFGGSVYLGWLSWKLLLVMGLFIIAGAACYRIIIVMGFRYLHSAREAEDRLFGNFRALTEGLKELKLHRSRRTAFLQNDLHTSTADFQRHSVAAETRFIFAHNCAHLLFFVLIGLILFLLPSYAQVDLKTLTGYVLTTLYLMGPLAGVMGSISVFTRAEVALRKIQHLGMTLDTRTPQVESSPGLPADSPAHSFKKIELLGVSHVYPNDQGEQNFVLGPLDLTFKPGELVFVVGGNGSGKSTLAKIISGLYPPENGKILLDGKPVDDSNRDEYRQLFSAIFSDFYVFRELLGLGSSGLDERANEYLRHFHLNHKVRVEDGCLSTTQLSQGQRKRLALLTAYLENRPFYVFDEWAADQDPGFKDIFYRQLLPELRQRRKTVLVITHDDRYFQYADRVLKLDFGQLVDTTGTDINQILESLTPVALK